MKKRIGSFFLLLFLLIGTFFVPQTKISAVNQCSTTIKANGSVVPPTAVPNGVAITLEINTSGLINPSWATGGTFTLPFGWPNTGVTESPSSGPDASGILQFQFPSQRAQLAVGNHTYTLKYDVPGDSRTAYELCTGSYTVSSVVSGSCSLSISPRSPSVQDEIKATFTNNSGQVLRIVINPINPNRVRQTITGYNDVADGTTVNNVPIPNFGVGTYRLIGETHGFVNKCTLDYEVTTIGGTLENQFVELCSFVKPSAMSKCQDCVNKDGIWTAIGCIPSTLDGFVKTVLPFGMGIGGGIAFLLMLFGALQIMTSAGNPEKLHAGSELLTSAIVGLLLIIFSIFLLRLIGAQILGIPGFGGGI